jgi:hypothetical protein
MSKQLPAPMRLRRRAYEDPMTHGNLVESLTDVTTRDADVVPARDSLWTYY